MKMRRIAVNTGGGDAPGLNAVIRAATLSAIELGFEVWGIRRGYHGLLEDDLVPLTRDSVRGITHLGGTILGAANRGDPFHMAGAPSSTASDRSSAEASARGTIRDRSADVIAAFRERGFEGLIAIGGDGSMRLARDLVARGLPLVIGVPKTIDNDVAGTDTTFGFDTAVAIATEALDRIHTTAEAHDRVMVVEVMGRTAGWIAAAAGLGGSADAILIPEIPFDLRAVAEKIRRRDVIGRRFSIVVVAEGATPIGGKPLEHATPSATTVLGGIGDHIARELAERTGKDVRALSLGHLLRGGQPTARDRVLALELGTRAALELGRRLAETGPRARVRSGMVGVEGNHFAVVDLDVPATQIRRVPTDGALVGAARHLGIAFGDEPRGAFEAR